jgi:murein DD-endopeptidase MepM/ murein hydrolase activator NlpD
MRISEPFARHGFTTAKFVITAMTAALLAGCSDSIERFSSNYNNPSDADPVYTASVPKYKKPTATHYAAPRALASNEEVIVQSPIADAPSFKPKAPAYDYTTAYKKPKLAYNTAPATPIYKAPIYKQPVMSEPVATAEEVSPAPATPIYKKPVLKAQAAAPMMSKAAATVQVSQGMTMYSIAKAHGVSVQQLAAANGIAAPYTVSMGQMLRMPGGARFAQVITKPVVEAQAEAVIKAPVTKFKAGASHTVASGDTLFSLGRKYGVSPFTIADLNGLSRSKALSLGQQLRIPAGATAKVAATEIPVEQPSQEVIADNTSVDSPNQKVAPLALPKSQPVLKQVAEAPADAAALAMRWPVKGKVISEFGAKPNGLKNEGINIAVPEGTSIRAAEGGVVAYAGNELKGYGNLILLRHAGGYVTAYAHASQLMVKRGDTVKRGDVIAKAGQTGAVQSPQLHFEVRKGASALDPYKYLTSSTAMN